MEHPRYLVNAEEAMNVARSAWEDAKTRYFNEHLFPWMQQNVGKCFKYKDCYSCPETASDYWWAYFRVASVTDGGYEGVLHQIDRNGKASIEPHTMWSTDGSIGIGWVECSSREYDDALLAIGNRVRAELMTERGDK